MHQQSDLRYHSCALRLRCHLIVHLYYGSVRDRPPKGLGGRRTEIGLTTSLASIKNREMFRHTTEARPTQVNGGVAINAGSGANGSKKKQMRQSCNHCYLLGWKHFRRSRKSRSLFETSADISHLKNAPVCPCLAAPSVTTRLAIHHCSMKTQSFFDSSALRNGASCRYSYFDWIL
jgi:hypothetical protein